MSQTLTLNPESNSGIDDVMMMLKIIPINIKMIPKYRQFLALRGSSPRMMKNAITPPIIPKNIGNKYHALLLGFSDSDILIPIILR